MAKKQKTYKIQPETEALADIVGKVLRGSVRKIVTELKNAGYRRLLLVDKITMQVEAELKGAQEAAKDILDEVSKHCGGAWLVELYKKYDLEAVK